MQRTVARPMLGAVGLCAALLFAEAALGQAMLSVDDKAGGYGPSPYDSLIAHGPAGPAYGPNHYGDVVGGGHGNGCAHCFWPCSGCAGEGALMCTGLRFEYLLWWTEGRSTPPLVATSTTDILYGDERIGEQVRNGGRITYNHLLGDGCTFLDVRFWGLENSTETFSATSVDNPVLGIPAFALNLGTETLVPVAFPGLWDNGRIDTRARSTLIGLDASLRQTWSRSCCYQVDVFAGYQFTRLNDSLVLNARTTAIDPAEPVFDLGTLVTTRDSFRTENEFHGAQVGFWTEKRHGYCSFEVLGKIAIGNMRQLVAIDGSFVAVDPVLGPATVDAGLLAHPGNIGEHERNLFAVVPEINVNFGYEFLPSWRATIGYTFIYWSNVALAGNQINPNIDFSPGADQPAFAFQGSGFWAHGLSFGLEHRW
jgi:hypothetical protein